MTKPTIYNERSLLLKVAAECEVSFRQLFDFYQPTIYTAALRMTGDASLAEDILQDTFLKVWINRSSLPEMENFSGWLYTVARNLMFDTLRSPAKQKVVYGSLSNDTDGHQFEAIEHSVHEKNLLAVVQEAIDRLPPKQRQAYTLIKAEGMTRENAARMLGVSPETVKSNLDHAMRSIRAFCIRKLEIIILFILVFRFF